MRSIRKALVGLLGAMMVTQPAGLLAGNKAKPSAVPAGIGGEDLVKHVAGTYNMSKNPYPFVVFMTLDQKGNRHPSFWAGGNAGGTVQFVGEHDMLEDTVIVEQKGAFTLQLVTTTRQAGMQNKVPGGIWADKLKDRNFHLTFEKIADAKIVGTRKAQTAISGDTDRVVVEATCLGTVYVDDQKAPFRGQVTIEFRNDVSAFYLKATFPFPGQQLGLKGASGENITATVYTASTSSFERPRVGDPNIDLQSFPTE